MNHRMAIGANRNQVFDWIDFVFLTNFSNWDNVMNMNKTFA